MVQRRLLALAAAIAASIQPLHSQTSQPRSRLAGTWLLESIVDTLRDGTVTYWMGRHPTGAIIYTSSGHVSVQFMRDPRPILPPTGASAANATRVAGTDPFSGLGGDDLRNALSGYYAYFGRYQVSAAGDSIAHFVETSLRPTEVGLTYRRAIKLRGDGLFISLDAEENGVPRHRVLTSRRAP